MHLLRDIVGRRALIEHVGAVVRRDRNRDRAPHDLVDGHGRCHLCGRAVIAGGCDARTKGIVRVKRIDK